MFDEEVEIVRKVVCLYNIVIYVKILMEGYAILKN